MSELRQLFINRYDKLYSNRALYEADLGLISDLVHPVGMVKNASNSKEGERTKRSQIVDNMAERAVDDLAAYITTTIAPVSTRWFMLHSESLDTFDNPEVKRKLDVASRKVLSYLKRPETNFQLAFDESSVESVPFGLGVMHARETPEGLHFSAIPMREVYVQENYKGDINAVIQVKRMTAAQILEEYVDIEITSFDLGDYEVTQLRERAANDPKYEYDILYGVFPKVDAIGRASGVDYPYVSIHVFKDGAGGNESGVLRNAGLKRFPYFPYRFRRRPGEPYGHGCGHRALSDIRILQRMKKDNLAVSQLTSRPPLHVPWQAYTKRLNLSPGAENHSKRTSRTANDKAEPLFLVGSLPISVEMEDRVRDAIREAFYLDAIKESKNNEMSATESNIRLRDRMATMNPSLQRIMNEGPTRIIEYTCSYLKERGELEELKGIENISVVYINVALKAQFDAELLGLDRLASVVLNLSKAFPDLPMSVAEEEIMPMIIERTFLPYKLMRDKKKVQEQKQMNQMQQQASMGADQSQSTLNLAKAASELGI
jgi:hypothetical protein